MRQIVVMDSAVALLRETFTYLLNCSIKELVLIEPPCM